MGSIFKEMFNVKVLYAIRPRVDTSREYGIYKICFGNDHQSLKKCPLIINIGFYFTKSFFLLMITIIIKLYKITLHHRDKTSFLEQKN